MPRKQENPAASRLRERFRELHAAAVAPVRYAVAVTGCPERHAQVLALLSERGRLNMTELSEALDISPPQATTLVDAMVAPALITRRPDDADRRKVYVEITAAGGRLLARYRDALNRALDEVISRIPASEVEAVAHALETLFRAMEKVGRDAETFGF